MLELFDGAVKAAGFDPQHYTYLNEASAICTDIGKFHYTDENEKYMCVFSMGHTYSMAITACYRREQRNGETVVNADVLGVTYSTYVNGELFSKHFQEYVDKLLEEKKINVRKDIFDHPSSGRYHSIVETAKREIFLKDYTDITLQLEDTYDIEDVELNKEDFIDKVRGDERMKEELNKLMDVFSQLEKDTHSRRNGTPLYICMCGSASRSIIVQDRLKKLSDDNKGCFHLSQILNEDECVARGLAYSFEGSAGRIPQLDLFSHVKTSCMKYESSQRQATEVGQSYKYITKELKIFEMVENEKKEFEREQNEYREICAQTATDV